MKAIVFSSHAKEQMAERGASEPEVIEAVIMKIRYDPEVDAAYIRLKEGRFQVTTHRLTEDVAVNYATDGSIVGIEVLDASKYLFKRNCPQVTLENVQPVT